MEIRLLGPLEVRDGDAAVVLPRRQQRALLAALALRAGEVVSTDRLVADLWGESAPASATGSLQNTVAALRKLLGRDLLVTQAPGYRLAIGREAVDVNRFERLLDDARHAGATERAASLREALALWRGPALADLDAEEFARLEAGRLDELRVTALEERIDAELELGRHAMLVGELEQLVATHPLRERLRGQLMLALYRCGRQAEALEVYRAARLALADELGLDPSPELQELERRILQQDPLLAASAAAPEEGAREATELRLVTVLAATPPADDDPERHRRLLDEALSAVREALDRHGGELERFGPEGLVAVFGAHGAGDDDAERAVLVARELGLSAGIATGEAVEGAGAVFTRAAELARVGGIRLDERTAALVGASRRHDAPLVGREEELARLQAELGAAREAGTCRVVTVVGEPGIGKTRLARELAVREGADTTVLVARCVAHGPGATFLPILGALRRAEPERALATEPDGDLVLARLGALAEGEAPLGESYWAIRRLLEALARVQPVLLVLDDVHWAEPALLDLVDYLGDRADAPLSILCLARPELERSPGEALALGPLAEGDAHAIAAGAAELDEATRARIVELAEGNALYLEQLASFASDGGEGLPPTLEAVLAGRLGRLEPAQRAVLQRAAVIGREFSLGAVAALSGGEVARGLLALSRAGFVHPAPAADPGDDGYTFHHVLLRDAAYAGLTKADRAELHERAAAWIDRDGPGDDALAGYHLEQAVRYRRDLGEEADELAAAAGERLGEAGMRVWRTNDVAAAVGLLGRAARVLPPGKLRAELLWELAIARRNAGASDAGETLSIALKEAVAAGAAPLRARAEAEAARWGVLTGSMQLDDAAVSISAAIDELERAGDRRGLGRARMAFAVVHSMACNFTEIRSAARLATADYLHSGFSPAVCIGMHAEALYYGPVEIARASAEAAQLLDAAADSMTEANVLAVIGALAAANGDVGDGRALMDRSREVFVDMGNVLGMNTVWSPLGMELEVYAGNLDEAARIGYESFDGLAAADNRAYASTRAAQLAEILLDRGDLDAADRFALFAEEHAVASDVLAQFLWRAMRARLCVAGGDLEAGEAMARDAVSIASHTDGLRDRARTHRALAEVLFARKRRTEATREAAEAQRLLDAKGVRAAAWVNRPANEKGARLRAPSL